jgi:hypothetical protein
MHPSERKKIGLRAGTSCWFPFILFHRMYISAARGRLLKVNRNHRSIHLQSDSIHTLAVCNRLLCGDKSVRWEIALLFVEYDGRSLEVPVTRNQALRSHFERELRRLVYMYDHCFLLWGKGSR